MQSTNYRKIAAARELAAVLAPYRAAIARARAAHELAALLAQARTALAERS